MAKSFVPQTHGHRVMPKHTVASGLSSAHSMRLVARKRAPKHISFEPRRNKVRFVRVPPRSQNRQYWFTETERVVKKGLIFEVEPGVNTEVAIDVRLQITAVSLPPELGDSPVRADTKARSFLEVREMNPLLGGGDLTGKWLTVGSAATGEVQRMRVVLPSGMYQLRTQGKYSLLAFAQAWDVERELS